MTTHPKSKLYTKSGDQGKTRLVDGSCVEKFNPNVEAYGCVDELNSQIGLILSLGTERLTLSSESKEDLLKIQHLLFNVGSLLACTNSTMLPKLPALTEEHISWIETIIDKIDAQNEELSQFILPGGCLIASQFHIARTLCRRTERRTAEIESTLDEHKRCLIFLNRLSDYFFAMARLANKKAMVKDTPWVKQ